MRYEDACNEWGNRHMGAERDDHQRWYGHAFEPDGSVEFVATHEDAYAYSSWTYDSAHFTIKAAQDCVCGREVAVTLASDESYDFGALMRELAEIAEGADA